MKTWLQFFIVTFLFFSLSLPVLFSVGSVCAVAADDEAGSPEVAIIKVRMRPAQELLPQVQTILSASGRASVDTISNAVIVSDSADTITRIRRLIQQLDVPTPQVTVTLRYHQAETRKRTLSTASGIAGPKAGLHITSGEFRRDKSLQITVGSGSTGYLTVGRKIPLTSFWLDLCSRYGYRFGWLGAYTTVGSGFEVRPLVLGNRVELSLTPRLSFGDDRSIEFTRATTRVTIPADTWVQLGTADIGINDVATAVLSANGQDNRRAMILEVKAHIH